MIRPFPFEIEAPVAVLIAAPVHVDRFTTASAGGRVPVSVDTRSGALDSPARAGSVAAGQGSLGVT